jgi:metal-responsive CopG/Arc/MetJ family transcriptional regulator
MKSQAINITIPKELLKKVDDLAKRDYTSRSDVIRQALLDKVRRNQVDEWGDEGKWESVVDFRDHGYPNGIPADEAIRILEKLKKNDHKK